MKFFVWRSALLLAAPLLFAIGPGPTSIIAQQSDPNVTVDPSLFQAMQFRSIGPHRGGRVTAVAGYPDRPYTFLMGTVGGGIWRTTDAGQTWHNISDGYLRVGPVGALAIAPSNQDIIYAGTGSGGVRGNISMGDGMYKSVDGGETWRWMGLPESEHINRIWVHPRDPNRLYVAALGHIFGPNADRGVYRSVDGGRNWQRVLFVSDRTGAIDLMMSPADPNTLYAAMWTAERKPWAIHSGSTEGGVFKTTDGGNTWNKLTNGLPEMIGRIGLAVSPVQPNRVYVLAESEGDLRGLYRSEDRGASFRHISDDRNLLARPWYYTHVDAHPTEPDVIFVSNESFFRSDDGGATLTPISTPHGDNHDLWINPNNPNIWIQSNDGGANITFNAGQTWSTQYNQPTAEFYTLEVDNEFPYRIYVPQQDNSTITVPSRVTRGLTPFENWFRGAGCETGPLAVHPDNPNIIYGGCKGRITRLNRETDQERSIWVWPLEYHGRANADLPYRRQWNSQIEFSPHDPNVIYHPSQYVHVTRDEGQTWETISPDLTNWEEHKDLHQSPPGGPLTYDQTGVEIYPTIFAFAESPLEAGVLWAGSDDGLIHISRDAGRSWTNVTPPGVELHSTVNEIVLSPHARGRAFAAIHRYRMDDFHPYIYRTNDYGETWDLLTDGTNGIPSHHPTRTIQEDPMRQGLLYAGTEFGVFVSFDDGAHWQSFQQDLPITPVMDLLVHQNDLIVATQGRSLWIMDDLTPLHQIDDQVASADAHLFRPRDAYRMRLQGGRRGGAWPENPPEGVMVFYHLSEQPASELRLTIKDAGGRVVREYSSKGAGDRSVTAPDVRPSEVMRVGERQLKTSPGMHRFVWDLKYPPAYLAPGVNEGFRERIAVVTGYTGGPYAVPGTYSATLSAGDWSQTQAFEVLKDPRLSTTIAELEETFDLSVRIRDRIAEMQIGIAQGQKRLRELDGMIASGDARAAGEARQLKADLEEVLGELYKHGERGDHAHLHPELTTDYARVYTMITDSDHRPPASAYQRLEELEQEFATHMSRLRRILDRLAA
jgi:photosystem II stability/assembly factor-like uncharacterized protein